MSAPPLHGFTVGLTADRRAHEQVLMLERLGVETVHAPAIRTLPLDGEGGLRAVTDALIAAPPDVVIANTGLGVRSWFGMAEMWGRDQALVEALGGPTTKVVARGPKAAAAAQMAGLDICWRPAEELLSAVGDGLIDEGVAGPLAGARIALQLHGDLTQSLGARLTAAGATVIEVPVYRWTLPEDREPALRLIDRCVKGTVDAVTFTAGPALHNLIGIAADAGRDADLVAAFNGPVAAVCMGPVCAAVARGEGIVAPLVPATWRLGSLVRTVGDHLAGRRRSLVCDGHTVGIQGSAVVIDGNPAHLTERERAVFSVLADHLGSTVTREAILRAVWDDPSIDPHALEAVIARLRVKLGPVGAAVETVVRRGYRFEAGAA